MTTETKRDSLPILKDRVSLSVILMTKCEHIYCSIVFFRGRAIKLMCDDCDKVFFRFGTNPTRQAKT